MQTKWEGAQEWEREWHGNCCNDYGEMEKQLLYARKMGLKFFNNGKSSYNIEMHDARVLDIGGGPCSLLLKCVNVRGVVADPLPFPPWVKMRYRSAGIEFLQQQGERLELNGFAECWIYNVLPHVEDPEKLIHSARRAASLIRIFDWIDTGIGDGHPISVSAKQLDAWLGGEGKVELFNSGICRGKAYYGIFPT